MKADEKDCIFCKIVRGELPTSKVFENEVAVVFADIAPQAPVHVLVVPKKHVVSLGVAEDSHRNLLGGLMLSVRDVASALGIKDAFQVKIFSGKDAGQTVFHLHLHVLGGWKQKQTH